MSGGWRVGRATITPVPEIAAGDVIQSGMAGATPGALARMPWLRPDFAHDDGRMKAVVQAFLVELDGRRILVDTAVGNGKPRPGLPAWSGLDTDFPRRLAALGAGTGDIDTVVCTHFHFDHVGWNTTGTGGAWRPTFPRARYVFSRVEFDYWRTVPARETADDRAGFADSVLPVYQAGLADLVAGDHQVCPGIRLLPTPGHTPGHVSVLVESAGVAAVVTGDAIHHPCQIAHPDWGVRADHDPALARRSRRKLLDRCAGAGILLIGSHFPPPAAVTVRRARDGYQVG